MDVFPEAKVVMASAQHYVQAYTAEGEEGYPGNMAGQEADLYQQQPTQERGWSYSEQYSSQQQQQGGGYPARHPNAVHRQQAPPHPQQQQGLSPQYANEEFLLPREPAPFPPGRGRGQDPEGVLNRSGSRGLIAREEGRGSPHQGRSSPGQGGGRAVDSPRRLHRRRSSNGGEMDFSQLGRSVTAHPKNRGGGEEGWERELEEHAWKRRQEHRVGGGRGGAQQEEWEGGVEYKEYSGRGRQPGGERVDGAPQGPGYRREGAQGNGRERDYAEGFTSDGRGYESGVPQFFGKQERVMEVQRPGQGQDYTLPVSHHHPRHDPPPLHGLQQEPPVTRSNSADHPAHQRNAPSGPHLSRVMQTEEGPRAWSQPSSPPQHPPMCRKGSYQDGRQANQGGPPPLGRNQYPGSGEVLPYDGAARRPSPFRSQVAIPHHQGSRRGSSNGSGSWDSPQGREMHFLESPPGNSSPRGMQHRLPQAGGGPHSNDGSPRKSVGTPSRFGLLGNQWRMHSPLRPVEMEGGPPGASRNDNRGQQEFYNSLPGQHGMPPVPRTRTEGDSAHKPSSPGHHGGPRSGELAPRIPGGPEPVEGPGSARSRFPTSPSFDSPRRPAVRAIPRASSLNAGRGPPLAPEPGQHHGEPRVHQRSPLSRPEQHETGSAAGSGSSFGSLQPERSSNINGGAEMRKGQGFGGPRMSRVKSAVYHPGEGGGPAAGESGGPAAVEPSLAEYHKKRMAVRTKSMQAPAYHEPDSPGDPHHGQGRSIEGGGNNGEGEGVNEGNGRRARPMRRKPLYVSGPVHRVASPAPKLRRSLEEDDMGEGNSASLSEFQQKKLASRAKSFQVSGSGRMGEDGARDVKRTGTPRLEKKESRRVYIESKSPSAGNAEEIASAESGSHAGNDASGDTSEPSNRPKRLTSMLSRKPSSDSGNLEWARTEGNPWDVEGKPSLYKSFFQKFMCAAPTATLMSDTESEAPAKGGQEEERRSNLGLAGEGARLGSPAGRKKGGVPALVPVDLLSERGPPPKRSLQKKGSRNQRGPAGLEEQGGGHCGTGGGHGYAREAPGGAWSLGQPRVHQGSPSPPGQRSPRGMGYGQGPGDPGERRGRPGAGAHELMGQGNWVAEEKGQQGGHVGLVAVHVQQGPDPGKAGKAGLLFSDGSSAPPGVNSLSPASVGKFPSRDSSISSGQSNGMPGAAHEEHQFGPPAGLQPLQPVSDSLTFPAVGEAGPDSPMALAPPRSAPHVSRSAMAAQPSDLVPPRSAPHMRRGSPTMHAVGPGDPAGMHLPGGSSLVSAPSLQAGIPGGALSGAEAPFAESKPAPRRVSFHEEPVGEVEEEDLYEDLYEQAVVEEVEIAPQAVILPEPQHPPAADFQPGPSVLANPSVGIEGQDPEEPALTEEVLEEMRLQKEASKNAVSAWLEHKDREQEAVGQGASVERKHVKWGAVESRDIQETESSQNGEEANVVGVDEEAWKSSSRAGLHAQQEHEQGEGQVHRRRKSWDGTDDEFTKTDRHQYGKWTGTPPRKAPVWEEDWGEATKRKAKEGKVLRHAASERYGSSGKGPKGMARIKSSAFSRGIPEGVNEGSTEGTSNSSELTKKGALTTATSFRKGMSSSVIAQLFTGVYAEPEGGGPSRTSSADLGGKTISLHDVNGVPLKRLHSPPPPRSGDANPRLRGSPSSKTKGKSKAALQKTRLALSFADHDGEKLLKAGSPGDAKMGKAPKRLARNISQDEDE